MSYSWVAWLRLAFIALAVISVWAHFGPLPIADHETAPMIRRVSFWTGNLSLPLFCLFFLADALIEKRPRATAVFWMLALVYFGIRAIHGHALY